MHMLLWSIAFSCTYGTAVEACSCTFLCCQRPLHLEIQLELTASVTQAATRHKTAPTATAALGRTLMGALLLGSFRKEDENIQVGRAGWYLLPCGRGGDASDSLLDQHSTAL
jgi:hypothetical protein